jgi:2-oxoglutarate dehydrogenase complex dehydrogenase (E1) component-like enzyme
VREVDALNSGYAGQLLEQYLENPDSVPAEWRALFELGTPTDGALAQALPGLGRLLERGDGSNGHTAVAAPPAQPDQALLNAVSAAASLVRATRTHGHRAAHLDPLGTEPPGDPALDPDRLGLTPELQARVPAAILRTYVEGETLADILPKLQET